MGVNGILPYQTTPYHSLLNDLKTLNADLATACDTVEGADRAPTTQAVKPVAALEQRLKKLLGGV